VTVDLSFEEKNQRRELFPSFHSANTSCHQAFFRYNSVFVGCSLLGYEENNDLKTTDESLSDSQYGIDCVDEINKKYRDSKCQSFQSPIVMEQNNNSTTRINNSTARC